MKIALQLGEKWHRPSTAAPSVSGCGLDLAGCSVTRARPAHAVADDDRCKAPGCRKLWPPHLQLLVS